jgi:hypothetical protein
LVLLFSAHCARKSHNQLTTSLTLQTTDLRAALAVKGILAGDDGATVASLHTSEQKKAAKKKAPETAGKGWYNLPATPLTAAIKHDLRIISMRNYLDPKRFYKKDGGRKQFPKYFQIGTMIGSESTDPYATSSGGGGGGDGGHFVRDVLDDYKTSSYLKRTFSKTQDKKGRRFFGQTNGGKDRHSKKNGSGDTKGFKQRRGGGSQAQSTHHKRGSMNRV